MITKTFVFDLSRKNFCQEILSKNYLFLNTDSNEPQLYVLISFLDQVSTDELMTCRESLLHHLPQRVKKRLEECSACIVKNGPLQEHRDSTGKVPVALTVRKSILSILTNFQL